MQNKTPFILIFLVSLITSCSNDDTTDAENDRNSPQPSTADVAVAEQSASSPNYEAGPAFCGKIRPPEIMAAFEFRLPLANVNVASEMECHYDLNVPGAQVALLIYRVQSITMYDMYEDSSQKTADIPNLGEEAILLGNVHVEVKLDDERALEVSLKVDNMSDDTFPMTVEESTEGVIRLARMLSVRL